MTYTNISYLLSLAFILTSCQGTEDKGTQVSCIAGIQMTVGEEIQYNIVEDANQSGLRIEQISKTSISLTRKKGNQEEVEIELTLDNSGYCPQYTSPVPLSEAEKYLLPCASYISSNNNSGEGTSPVGPPSSIDINKTCTTSAPYETCKSTYELYGKSYREEKTENLDSPTPGTGITEFKLWENEKLHLHIEMIEWNGL